MEVVSTSNLVSSENGKKKKAAYNFQTMAMKSVVMPRDWPDGNLFIYANIKLFVVSLWQNCEIVP